MRPTLPSAFRQILRDFALLLIVGAGCHHAEAPVAPGPPLAAEPDTQLASMDAECAGLEKAIVAWGACPNLDGEERDWLRSLVDAAEQGFAAGRRGNPDEDNQRAIALACHRAAVSIGYATQRCNAGPKPKVD
jgi:hypothetical protein